MVLSPAGGVGVRRLAGAAADGRTGVLGGCWWLPGRSGGDPPGSVCQGLGCQDARGWQLRRGAAGRWAGPVELRVWVPDCWHRRRDGRRSEFRGPEDEDWSLPPDVRASPQACERSAELRALLPLARQDGRGHPA